MNVLNHLILAFVFVTQMLWLQGCSQHVKVFECKVQCDANTSLECSTSVSGTELDLD